MPSRRNSKPFARLCVFALAGVMLTGCASIPAGQRSALAEWKPSPNHGVRNPTVIVLHYTVEDTLEGSRDILSDAERKQIARDIQQNAWDFVPHMYYGQWFQPAALRKLTGLIGMPELIPFWNVRKG